MTQLQISIHVDPKGKLKVQMDVLKREDSTEPETMMAKNMETIFVEQFKAIAKEAGLSVKEKRVK
jgi:hypothetical protein